ncbi:hypothetical protein [Geodermatophilus sp. CPCC 205761]|uniref:hypothetical protein n=1 Tax=Geodermatophilus sp. CPCC 205761 TaxID=2936597 RepID=UPI003EEF1C9F
MSATSLPVITVSPEGAAPERPPWARLVLGLTDSALPSLGNLGVSVLAAHSMGLEDFGVFTTLVLVLILLVGVSRSVHGDVLVLTVTADPSETRRRARGSLSSVARLGLVAGSLGVFAGALTVGAGATSWGLALMAGGAVLPVLLLQDHYRWIAYADGRIADSVCNNAAWTTSSIAAMAMVSQLSDAGLGAAPGLLVWGLAAAPGVLVSVARSRCVVPWRLPGGWLSENRGLAGALLQDFGLLQASAQGALILLAALTSAADMALLRKAQIWLGPVTMATTGLLSTLQSMLARGRARGAGARSVARTASVVGAVGTLTAVAFGGLVAVLPSTWAAVLVSVGWSEARWFVWPLAIQLAAGVAGGCAGVALRALGAVREQVRIRWVLAPASLLCVVVSVGHGGALTAAWALAGISVLTAALWAVLLARSVAVTGRGDVHLVPGGGR